MKTSITIKLWFIFLLLNVITLTFLGTYSFYQAKKAIIERTFDQLTSLRIEKKNRIEHFFADRKREVNLFISSPECNEIINSFNKFNQNANKPGISGTSHIYKSILNNAYFSNHFYISDFSKIYEIIDLKKAELKEYILDDSNNQFATIINQQADNHKTIIIESDFIDQMNNIPRLYILKKVKNEISDSLLIFFQINHDAINSIMFDNNIYNGLGKSGEAYLVGEDYLMRSTSRFEDNSVYKTKVKTKGVIEAFNNNPGINIFKDYRNISVLSSYSKVETDNLNWVILAEIDKNEAMLPIYTFRNSILYLSIIITILLIGVVALISQLITLPIKRLKDATKKISEGNYNTSIESTSNDEIGQLTSTFNSMVLKIKEQTDRLKQERSMRLKSMLKGQELERQRLSRELHDGLGQLILAMKLKLQQSINATAEKKDLITTEVISHFEKAIKEVRNISNDLMPAELREFGFEKALKELVKEIEKTTSIKIDMVFQSELEVSNFEQQTYLYRIFQEALSNIIKHAKANEVNIYIKQKDSKLHIDIVDNGIGFSNTKPYNGNGINNMKERVSLLNGKIDINSSKNGTSIQIIIPN